MPNADASLPDIPTPDAYWQALQPHLPVFALDEQRVATALYRELAKGQAVDAVQLARSLGVSLAETRALLQRDSIKTLSYADGEGRLLGFGGLAVVPMHHRFEVDGRQLSTWCSWDSLFIPEILGQRAHVTSADPQSGGTVRLTVAPEQIERVEPNDAVISFIRPDARVFKSSAANVMAGFCHFIFFFESRLSGDRWASKHPGTFLFSLDDAFALAKRLNANNFESQLVLQNRGGAPA
jgi:alkylmercury lyase